MKKKLICIEGRSSAGKDSLVNALLKRFPNFLKVVVSRTTRPMREGETNGVEHWFHSKEEFDKIIESNKDDIIAYTHIKKDDQSEGYEYFTLKEDLENANVYIIDPKGVEYLKSIPDLDMDIYVIYIYTSDDIRRKRAKNSRSDYETEYDKRVENEKDQFDKVEKNKAYDFIVMNDFSFDDALDQLVSCINQIF